MLRVNARVLALPTGHAVRSDVNRPTAPRGQVRLANGADRQEADPQGALVSAKRGIKHGRARAQKSLCAIGLRIFADSRAASPQVFDLIE